MPRTTVVVVAPVCTIPIPITLIISNSNTDFLKHRPTIPITLILICHSLLVLIHPLLLHLLIEDHQE